MKLRCGITTARRPNGANYLPRTVRSLLLAGVDSIDLYAEPFSDLEAVLGEPVRIHQRAKRLGNWHNWRSMAIDLLDESADMILTCEDDIEVDVDAFASVRRFLAEIEPDRRCLLSLYTAWPFSGEFQVWKPGAAGPSLVFTAQQRSTAEEMSANFPGSWLRDQRFPAGWRKARPGNWLGNCCLLWPRSILEAVVSHPAADEWQGLLRGNRPTPPAEIAGVDSAISLILQLLNVPIYSPIPSLCQHIGEVSSLGDKPFDERRRAG